MNPAETQKYGLDRVTWMGRFADVMIEAGLTEAEALEEAIAGWDAACAEIAYAREDGQ